MFEVAEAYELQMGRWSRQLAPLLLEFAGIDEGERILDVGCGTGALAGAAAALTGAAEIVGIDKSASFVRHACAQIDDPRLRFMLGDAGELDWPPASFDRCVSLLAINHIGNAPKAAREMRRVTKPGGVIAAAMWDGTGGNEFNDCMWDVAAMLDPKLERPAEKRGSYGSPEALTGLWTAAGLSAIEVKELGISCAFESFEEFWQRYREGQGPGGAYVAALPEDHRATLRRRLRERVLRGSSDGPFALRARVWAIRGLVPGK